LTQRAERLYKLHHHLTWTPNTCMDVSAEDERVVDQIDFLRETNTENKFLFCKPLIGHLNNINLSGFNWVIAAGESGRKARPMGKIWV
jgi:protein gp37